ncbi:MAG: DNA mismatch repair protein MutS [Acholeplasmatales bacterium]|nr:DNA mismatch repair protein MutS [Acholeplasmatales bacterium]
MRLSEVKKEYFTPMIQQYIDVKEKYMDGILFYRIGDFYEMFFDDAYIASRELELQLTGKDAGYTERVPMCGIPFHAYLEYAKTLVEKGYKVIIVEQVEDPSQAKGLVKRDVVKIITPGTLVQTGLNDRENNFIASIYKIDRSYALSYADISTGEIYLTTINNINTLLNEIVNLNSKEIVVSKTFDTRVLDSIKTNYQVLISVENNEDLNEDFKYVVFGLEEKFYNAIGLLTNYLVETQRQEITHLQPVKYYTNSDFLHIDPFTKRNLELTESMRQHQKAGSLLHLLDKCQTAMGSRMLHKWIDRPLKDIDEINNRLNYVEAIKNSFVVKEDIKADLKTIYDLERIIGRISCGNANAKDLVQLRHSLSCIPALKADVAKLDVAGSQGLSDSLNCHTELFELLEKALVENPPLTVKEGGMIKEGYNAELDQIKSISKNSKEWIANYEKTEQERTGIKTMHVGYNRVFGYFIEVSRGALSSLTDSEHYIRKQTLANAERFITPELKEYEQIVLGSDDKIVKIEYELFKELRDKAESYTKSLQVLANIISTIDCLLSLAECAIKYKYVRPTFNNTRNVKIINGRHPVVESMLNDNFVANDCILNKYNEVLITGPNMSGKSTYMRQLALIAIMAQIGSFVPADVCDIQIFDQIFTRIGASDDLMSGQSTFMVEMLEANYAISHATKDSLILFDELGRGTATYDGMAIAQSIIEYVSQKIGCAMLFSTHYHELCDLVKTLPHLKNVHVEAKEINGKITFLHKVLDGGADKSYGINVASLAGLPRSLLKRAEQILEVLEDADTRKEANLNLFNFEEYEEKPENKEEARAIALLHEIENLNLDEMSGRDALNYLYDKKNNVIES